MIKRQSVWPQAVQGSCPNILDSSRKSYLVTLTNQIFLQDLFLFLRRLLPWRCAGCCTHKTEPQKQGAARRPQTSFAVECMLIIACVLKLGKESQAVHPIDADSGM